jgi:NADP-dependent 3-hydroxy acid dehydrogenase YdfG
MSNIKTIANRSVLVTGANRGIGQALVEEALRRGAKRVYAGARRPLAHPDERVTPLVLDITDLEQIGEAVDKVESLDILINNAGLALYDDLSDRAVLEQHLAVNLFGTWGMTRAFLPSLTRSRGAVAVLTGPTDTEMSRDLDVPKASPQSVARAILDGVERGDEDIFPDPMSETVAKDWRSGAAKALERQNAALVGPELVG